MDTSTLRLQITPAEGAPFDYSLRGDTLVVARGVPFADDRTLVLARRLEDPIS